MKQANFSLFKIFLNLNSKKSDGGRGPCASSPSIYFGPLIIFIYQYV